MKSKNVRPGVLPNFFIISATFIMSNKIQTPKYPARALHFILKIGDRKKNIQFFREVLGMKVLRHEEFTEECNSLSDRSSEMLWSKTLLGYGFEDEYFTIELIWNSEVRFYKIGNGLQGFTIVSRDSIARAKALKWPVKIEEGINILESPDGYRFFLIDKPEPSNEDPIVKVTLSSRNIGKSVIYWSQICGMALVAYKSDRVTLAFGHTQVLFEFLHIVEPINHGTANGRIAFSIPFRDLQDLETTSRDTKHMVLTSMVCLDVPGKHTVNVVVLADIDGHEICFVDDESFRKISSYDPHGEAYLYYSMNKFEKNVKNSLEDLSKQLLENSESKVCDNKRTIKHIY